jgi:hypothetical protein
MQDALAPAIKTLDDVPEATKLRHLWQVYTGIGFALMVLLGTLGVVAIKFQIRDMISEATQEMRTNVNAMMTEEEYERDQVWRERLSDQKRNELSARITRVEEAMRQNTETLSRIERGVEEISGRRSAKLSQN